MKTRTTLILLAVVAALALWIKFYESKQPNTEDASRREAKMLNFERDQLEGIVVHNGDDKIELRRANGKWRLEAPIKDQADASMMATLISDLEDWQKDQTIPEKEIDADKNALAEYDLVKPKLRLKLQGKEMPPEILFGKDGALEGRMYVRFADSRETYLARQTVRDGIAKKPEEFRDRGLTEISAAQVTRFILKTAAGEMEVEKRDDLWEIVKPLRARGDAQKIKDLLAQVTTAQIQQFIADDRGDLQPYGLADPRGSITLFTGEEKQGQMLQIGVPHAQEKEQVHVRFSARGFVYTLEKKIEEILNTTPATLRDRRLTRIDANILDRITIDAPGRSKTVLARKERGWVIANRNDQAANTAEVTRLISSLESEQVTKFVEDVASDLPKYGLDQPQLQLTLSSFASENTAETGAGEKPFATIAFGRSEGESVYARVGEEPFIVAVRRAFLDNLWSDPVQWQELAIFKFKPDDVQQLTVATDQEVALKRGANKEWVRAAGDEPVNATNAQSLLNTLTNLRAVRWIGGGTPAQAFEKVQGTITFSASPEGEKLHKLVIGGPAGEGMWYGRVDGRDGVFVLSNPDFNALRLPLTDLPAASPAISPAVAPPMISPAATPL